MAETAKPSDQDSSESLLWWRQAAQERAGKLMLFRRTTSDILAALDKEHPEWLAAHVAAGENFLAQDSRRSLFTGIGVILQNAFFAHLFVNSRLM